MKKSKRSKINFRYTIHLGVSIKCIAGEAKSVTDEKAAPSTETTLLPVTFGKHIQCRQIRIFLPMLV